MQLLIVTGELPVGHQMQPQGSYHHSAEELTIATITCGEDSHVPQLLHACSSCRPTPGNAPYLPFLGLWQHTA